MSCVGPIEYLRFAHILACSLPCAFLSPVPNCSVISADSIRSALGEDISEEELRAMILAGDLDGDSLVSKK